MRDGEPAKLAFVDCETTGLDETRHEVWDVAIIVARHGGSTTGLEIVTEYEAHPAPLRLSDAEPTALRLTNFYERTRTWQWQDPADVAQVVAATLAGAHIIGAAPDFDSRFLSAFLRTHGAAPAWHYHLGDVENMAAGLLRMPPPWNSEDLSRALGIEPDEAARHTALGDARWAMAMYEAVMFGGAS